MDARRHPVLSFRNEIGDDAQIDAPANAAAEHQHAHCDRELHRALAYQQTDAAGRADDLPDSEPDGPVPAILDVCEGADGRLQQLRGGGNGRADAQGCGFVHVLPRCSDRHLRREQPASAHAAARARSVRRAESSQDLFEGRAVVAAR